MRLEGRVALMLGGSGLVGLATARRLLSRRPARIVISALRAEEAEDAVAALTDEAEALGVELAAESGDIFVRESPGADGRPSIPESASGLAERFEDIFGPLDEAAISRSRLVTQLSRHRPDIVIDCINTATAIAYQDSFDTVVRVRKAAQEGGLLPEQLDAHLATLYLPQLIRHVQLLTIGLERAGASSYVKIGTSGTGGMGMNVPFTHSEERPSRKLLAKAGLAGAHSNLLFLLARTPDAPAVVEIKPAAAIAWKGIGFGPIRRGGRALRRVDSVRPALPEEAFSEEAVESGDLWTDTGELVESVYLDAGENGLFALSEFETITSLGLMEFVTPEEIARAVIAELEGRPTGHDIIGALDGAAFGPTYRAGVMREAALTRMETLEREHDVRSVAFDMLGPPRLNKLLFEASILERLFGELGKAAKLDGEATAQASTRLIDRDARLRTDVLSMGIPILRPDGLLSRGPNVKIEPAPGTLDVDRLADQGWVDLRPASWVQWRERCLGFLASRYGADAADRGSAEDLDPRARSEIIRPGVLAAYALRVEERGERIKR